ncbi:MAG: FAD-dependent oxidoreductase [Candidatus Omnitrophica bacterium]|jgi:ferredoxin-NADP reductase|nr:FAD-dependent oxidoreductase [Candidatus Omnitrophota bacterium]
MNAISISANLIQRLKRTSDIESFRFSVSEKINFLPGQFLKVLFDTKNSNNKELNKYLSFSSSPTKDYIEVTKKLTGSAFSERLNALETGDKVYFQGPLGNCIFKAEYKKIAFLIGGIGITPAISIIEYIYDKKLDNDVVLLYSNRTEEIAFKKELDFWQTTNNIKVYYTVTDCKPTDNKCIAGLINQELLLQKIKDWPQRVFFVFGPQSMINSMKKLCFNVGCEESNIKTEVFVGY